MTSLMHNRTNLLTIIGPHLPNPAFQIPLQQNPFPPPLGAYTSPPPSNLSFVIITSSALVEPRVPLEPSPWVVGVIYPATGLPLLD